MEKINLNTLTNNIKNIEDSNQGAIPELTKEDFRKEVQDAMQALTIFNRRVEKLVQDYPKVQFTGREVFFANQWKNKARCRLYYVLKRHDEIKGNLQALDNFFKNLAVFMYDNKK